MGIITNIKLNYAAQQLSRIKKKRKRARGLLRFDEAKSILIVFSWKNQAAFEHLQKVVKEMKKECPSASIHYLCHFRQKAKNIPESLQKEDFIHLSKSDVNWLGTPKKDFLNSFLKKDFDILVDFTFVDFPELLFAVGAANCRLKTGPDISGRNKYYDLMIAIREGEHLRDFAANLIHYLKVFKSK